MGLENRENRGVIGVSDVQKFPALAMVGQYSVVATGRVGAGLMVATLVLVNVGWSAMRGGFRVRIGKTAVWGSGSSPQSHAQLRTPGLDRRPTVTQTGPLPGRRQIDSDERRVVDGPRQVGRGTELTPILFGWCSLRRQPNCVKLDNHSLSPVPVSVTCCSARLHSLRQARVRHRQRWLLRCKH